MCVACGRAAISMWGILLPAQRYGKSSRGTPRLRRAPRRLHGAPRLALQTTRAASWCCLLGSADDLPRWFTVLSVLSGAGTWPLAHCGNFPLSLGPTFEVRWVLSPTGSRRCPTLVPSTPTSGCEPPGCATMALSRLPSWLFNPRRQALTLLAHRLAVLLMPNVRAKPAPAGKCQARAVENVPRHRPGLAFCCWGSA